MILYKILSQKRFQDWWKRI